MDDLTLQLIEKMKGEINIMTEELMQNPLFEKILRKKKLVNELAIDNGGEVLYRDVDSPNSPIANSIVIKPGQFVGRPLAKAVREYLEMRGKDNPPTYSEIEEALKQGDFEFQKVGNVRQALVKNNANFKLLGGDKFGLVEWYYAKGRKVRTLNKEDVKELFGEEAVKDLEEKENKEN